MSHKHTPTHTHISHTNTVKTPHMQIAIDEIWLGQMQMHFYGKIEIVSVPTLDKLEMSEFIQGGHLLITTA